MPTGKQHATPFLDGLFVYTVWNIVIQIISQKSSICYRFSRFNSIIIRIKWIKSDFVAIFIIFYSIWPACTNVKLDLMNPVTSLPELEANLNENIRQIWSIQFWEKLAFFINLTKLLCNSFETLYVFDKIQSNSLTMISTSIDVPSVHRAFYSNARTSTWLGCTHMDTIMYILVFIDSISFSFSLSRSFSRDIYVHSQSESQWQAYTFKTSERWEHPFKRHIKENVIYEVWVFLRVPNSLLIYSSRFSSKLVLKTNDVLWSISVCECVRCVPICVLAFSITETSLHDHFSVEVLWLSCLVLFIVDFCHQNWCTSKCLPSLLHSDLQEGIL